MLAPGGPDDAAPGADEAVARRGVRLEVVREGPADIRTWQFDPDDHQILVWRRGTAKRKQTVMANGRIRSLPLRQGSVWVIPAGARSYAMAEQTSAVEFLRLSIDPSLVGPDGLRSVQVPHDQALRSMLERIASTAGRVDTVARLLRGSLFDATRLHVLDAYGVRSVDRRPRGRDLGRQVRAQLVEFLQDGLDRDITVEAMAEMAGMSVSRFRKSFPTEFGMTPHQYLLEMRIERAKNLLATTDLSIAEVGALSGFSRPSHFAATFKGRVGVSPTGFRGAQR